MQEDGYGTGQVGAGTSMRDPADLSLGEQGAATTGPPADKPLGQLLSEFAKEISVLVHEEVQLAKVEVTEKGKRLGAGAAMFAVAAVCGLLAAGALVATATAALALAVPVWLAALIIGCLLLAMAGLFGLSGLAQARRATPPLPSQALESTKEDVAWLQRQLKSARR